MSRWRGNSIDISLRENKNWRGDDAADTKKEEETKKRGCVYANRYVHSNGTGTRNWSSNWPLGKSSGRIAKIAQCVPVIEKGKG